MRTVRTLLVWLLAVSWLPAVLHCAIEQAALIPTSEHGCCSSSESKEPGAPQDHCTKDSCELFENGHYKQSSTTLKAIAPDWLVCLPWVIERTLKSVVVPRVSPDTTDSPPELRNTWQFAERAALAPRAPSLAS